MERDGMKWIRIKQNRGFKLEDTHNDNLIYVPDQFRADQRLLRDSPSNWCHYR